MSSDIYFQIGPKIALYAKNIYQFVLQNALDCEDNRCHL